MPGADALPSFQLIQGPVELPTQARFVAQKPLQDLGGRKHGTGLGVVITLLLLRYPVLPFAFQPNHLFSNPLRKDLRCFLWGDFQHSLD